MPTAYLTFSATQHLELEMTTFWRSGFWRTSVNGVPHWVDGHFVDRDVWDRSSWSSNAEPSFFWSLLNDARAGGSATSTYVNPNANCPVCGAPVFFYQSEHGSRVFFDELGPPWPKHPCTDNSAHEAALKGSNSPSVSPSVRSPHDTGFIRQWLQSAAHDPEQDFRSKYGLASWAAYELEVRIGRSRNAIVALRQISEEKQRRIFLRVKGLPQQLLPGAVVFYYRGWISFFDTSACGPTELPVERLKSASHFIDALINKSLSAKSGT